MGWSGRTETDGSSVVVKGPRVVASFPLGIRATLLDRGDWAAVHALLEQRDLDAMLRLEELRRTDWLPLSAHLSLIEAVGGVLGLDGIRELGFIRTQANTMGGLYPNLLRSWVRSFRDDPGNLFRIGPQIWQSAFREAGDFIIDDLRPHHAHARIIDCAPLATSPAWLHLVEGVAAGILHLADLHEHVLFRSDGVSTTKIDFEWYAATGT